MDTMKRTESHNNTFQYYMDKYFKFPSEIKNDLVYCQRGLKSHIKVHQMVIDIFGEHRSANSYRKSLILKNLEQQIFEINAEQHYLLLRLRRIIDEFLKLLTKKNIEVDIQAINSIISQKVAPLINDDSIIIVPVTVAPRYSEQKLIEKYFLTPNQQNTLYCDEDVVNKPLVMQNGLTNTNDVQTSVQLKNDVPSNVIKNNETEQISLLKPKSQRIYSNKSDSIEPVAHKNSVEDAMILRAAETVELSLGYDKKQSNDQNVGKEDEMNMNLPVSTNVKKSRLNLRQALKKAHNANMAAKAAALSRVPSLSEPSAPPQESASVKVIPESPKKQSKTKSKSKSPSPKSPSPKSPSPKSPTLASLPTAISIPDISTIADSAPIKISNEVSIKKLETKTKTVRSSTNSAATTKPKDNSSSSDDSNLEHALSPPQYSSFVLREEGTLPENYSQEMFLGLFGLFKPEVVNQMQQRRSKRKRRTVNNNEKADFHYGRIEGGMLSFPLEKKKKRKEFLLSPQIKSKRQKRKSPNIESEPFVPSSQEEKSLCNKCLKPLGILNQCTGCKGFFHPTCLLEEELKQSDDNTGQDITYKLCPSCHRAERKMLKKESEQFNILNNTAQELKKQMGIEKLRRITLQQKSKKFKTQMRNLFNIVNTFKDQELDKVTA